MSIHSKLLFDEKFRQTIMRNSNRLRQKSNINIGPSSALQISQNSHIKDVILTKKLFYKTPKGSSTKSMTIIKNPPKKEESQKEEITTKAMKPLTVNRKIINDKPLSNRGKHFYQPENSAYTRLEMTSDKKKEKRYIKPFSSEKVEQKMLKNQYNNISHNNDDDSSLRNNSKIIFVNKKKNYNYNKEKNNKNENESNNSSLINNSIKNDKYTRNMKKETNTERFTNHKYYKYSSYKKYMTVQSNEYSIQDKNKDINKFDDNLDNEENNNENNKEEYDLNNRTTIAKGSNENIRLLKGNIRSINFFKSQLLSIDTHKTNKKKEICSFIKMRSKYMPMKLLDSTIKKDNENANTLNTEVNINEFSEKPSMSIPKKTKIKKTLTASSIFVEKNLESSIKNIKIKSTRNINEGSFKKNDDNEYIISFMNEIIMLAKSIDIQSLFSILIININNKYLLCFNKNSDFPYNKKNFIKSYKYFCIILTCLMFLNKDENNYNANSTQVKKIFEMFLYIFFDSLEFQKNISSSKIKRFLQEYKEEDKNIREIEEYSLEKCTIKIINIIFTFTKEYSYLKQATDQLLIHINLESIDNIIKIINSIFLYCLNHKPKNNCFSIMNNNISWYKKSSISNNHNYNKKIKTVYHRIDDEESKPQIPFIKTVNKKKFCLVLDMDETLLHTLNLSFGNYFLLRPGVIEFLEEVSQYYEIIVFTCSPKIYADNILNKIDVDNILISHRLYRNHVTFEKGRSVKKLDMIGRDLKKTIFIDNLKCNAKYNPQNLYLISSWTSDIYDEEIKKLKNKLIYIATNDDYKDDIRKGIL